ncbi:MAG: class I SAM-dependent methyltransferase [Chitinophagaceae bacterium]|nr:class I SAM-dependent methyltransferase [Chitinophagaceae bacterium]
MDTRSLISEDRINELIRLLRKTPKGLCAELGVYKGGSLKLMAEACPNREFWGFDTFEGLPEADWNEAEVHHPGDFNDTSLEAVQLFLKDNPNVKLIKGYFPQSIAPFEKDDLRFSFIHVDTDFYQSVKACIDYFYPRLKPGGIIVFDDYDWIACPGVKRALDESKLPYKPTLAKYQAYIRKPLSFFGELFSGFKK